MGQRRCSTVLILRVLHRGSSAGGLGVLMIESTSWFGGFDDRVNAGGLGVLVLKGGNYGLSVYWLKGG